MSISRPDAFPITAARLSASVCATLFYGIYLVTCTICARNLLTTGSGKERRWVHSNEIRWLMAIVALILLMLCTFDVSVGLLHTFRAFADSPGAVKELLQVSSWISIAISLNQGIAMVIGDFILVYRCWIVYARRWLIITPSLILYIANLAIGGVLIVVMAKVDDQTQTTFVSSRFRPWVLAFYGGTAVQNVLTTGILIWGIWRVERRNSGLFIVHQPRRLRRVIRVIAESGAAYTSCVFISFVVIATGSNALYPIASITLQMAGIAFNVVLIRSSPSRDEQFTVFEQQRRTIGNAPTNIDTVGDSTDLSQQGVPEDIRLVRVRLGSMNDANKGPSQYNIHPEGSTTTTGVKP